MSKYRGRGGRIWTEGDLAELKRLYLAGQTFTEIGAALKRSRGNCVAKAHALNLPPRDRETQSRRGFENYALSLISETRP